MANTADLIKSSVIECYWWFFAKAWDTIIIDDTYSVRYRYEEYLNSSSLVKKHVFLVIQATKKSAKKLP